MKKGDTVYTVNNKTKSIDSWSYAGTLRTPDELLVQVTRGKQYMFIPARCVFTTEAEARRVLNK